MKAVLRRKLQALSAYIKNMQKDHTTFYFTVWTAKLNQHKGILLPKFEFKDMLLWKRDSSFVSTEDENL